MIDVEKVEFTLKEKNINIFIDTNNILRLEYIINVYN